MTQLLSVQLHPPAVMLSPPKRTGTLGLGVDMNPPSLQLLQARYLVSTMRKEIKIHGVLDLSDILNQAPSYRV